MSDTTLTATSLLPGYRKLVRTRILILIALAVGVLAAFLLDLMVGPSSLSPADALRGIFQPDTLSPPVRVIIWNVRLPYALMALLVGSSLSLAGAEMQTILNNPLASPFTLGLSGAASLGAAMAIVLGIGIPGVSQNWVISANAFAFCFASAILLQALTKLRGTGPETLVLFGIALVFTFHALVSLIQFVASEEALQQLVFWSMGSLARANWPKLGILALIVFCVTPFSFASSWKMTALRLGEDRARSFGVNVPRLRFLSLLRISLLAATTVAFTGTIAFVGLVGPHIARLLLGEDHRFFLPGSALAGALVMSLASVASKSILPGVLIPVGIVTSLIGVPAFLALILTKRERG
ncbi:iron complex transport system permease protein [Faunimonas pinastri]|uniref:Iron complex transport system permease protein n=1 Tax=Faunimonas pinastri TaxID=1855383 RepID=A0A1H9FWE5_9HYPH|nr:iron ABC transporter permease [Faunimonas pinastri]SEQ42232.1 iron complex transport system permease protein [Faunimonas pinastri]